MSATICPSCLSKSFEAGRCGKCGFTAAEYKPPRTALPLGTVVGSYRIGLMKSNSRQSQVYTAVHTETSAPVIIEEFFPAAMVGRVQGKTEVSLVKEDEDSLQRFQQGCLLLEASAQKRPLKRLESFRANNTVYSVFEPAGTVSVAAQCEMMADNPYYFRDQNGMPMMSINLLTIPPMPKQREYNPEQYKKQAPITQPAEDEDFAGRLITENAAERKRKKLLVILAGIAAVLVIGVAVLFILHPWQKKLDLTKATIINTQTVKLFAEKRIQQQIEEEEKANQAPEPVADVLAALQQKEKLSKEEFMKLLCVIPEESGVQVTGQLIDSDGEDPIPTGGAPIPITDDDARLVDWDGHILREHKEDDGKKMTFYYVVTQQGSLYRVEAGTAEESDDGEWTFTGKNRLAFVLWRDLGENLKTGEYYMKFVSIGEGTDKWLDQLRIKHVSNTEQWQDAEIGIYYEKPSESETTKQEEISFIVTRANENSPILELPVKAEKIDNKNGSSDGSDGKDNAPTELPTETPTEPPMEAPTEPPTEAQAEQPTETTTEPPTEAPAIGKVIKRDVLVDHMVLVSAGNSRGIGKTDNPKDISEPNECLQGRQLIGNDYSIAGDKDDKYLNSRIPSGAKVKILQFNENASLILMAPSIGKERFKNQDAEEKKDMTYYVAVSGKEGLLYRVQICSTTAVGKENNTIDIKYSDPDDGKRTRLALKLWCDVDELKEGSLLYFAGDEGNTWFESLITSEPHSLNDVLNWDDADYSVEIVDSKPVLNVAWKRGSHTFVLEIPEEDDSIGNSVDYNGDIFSANDDSWTNEKDNDRFRKQAVWGDEEIRTTTEVTELKIMTVGGNQEIPLIYTDPAEEGFVYSRVWKRKDSNPIFLINNQKYKLIYTLNDGTVISEEVEIREPEKRVFDNE